MKWLIFGAYRTPCRSAGCFFKHARFPLDIYRQTHEKFFFFAGDFNTEDTEPVLSEFLTNYDCNNLVEDKTCFKNPENPRCIDLFTTNSIMIFKIQQQ